MASIRNDERTSFGVMSGHDRKTLSLSDRIMTPEIASIRASTAADAPALARIYAWQVQNGTGTFETEVPDAPEMATRREAVVSKGLPWLVAERGGDVLGFAYANHFRPRGAYRFCLDGQPARD